MAWSRLNDHKKDKIDTLFVDCKSNHCLCAKRPHVCAV